MYKIYEIRCNITDEVYFGKTIRTLGERLAKHKCSTNCYSKQIIERGNYDMKQIDQCDNEEESIFLEKFYIINNECVNKYIPGRTKKEYDEYVSEYHKKYHKKHREKKIQYAKEYYKNNKETCLKKKKIYDEKNKDKIKEKNKEKYNCPCGSTLTIRKKLRHEKSKKHQNYLSSLNNKDAVPNP